MCAGHSDGFGRERAIGREASESAGADAEPDATTPASVETVVGERLEQGAKQECADHVDAERGDRNAGPLRHQQCYQIPQSGADGAAGCNDCEARPREMASGHESDSSERVVSCSDPDSGTTTTGRGWR